MENDLKEEMGALELGHCLDDELGFLSISGSSYEIKVEKNYQAKQQVYASESHIRQVFGNIIKNALEAMYQVETKEFSISTEDGNGVVITRFAIRAREFLLRIWKRYLSRCSPPKMAKTVR